MWLADGEKYALVGLSVKFEGEIPPEQVAPKLWVLTNTSLEVPDHWREWLGSIRTEEVTESNLFLVSKLSSVAPQVLDNESKLLHGLVFRFYVGLLLSAMFSPAHRPFILTGGRQDGVIDVRQHSALELPVPQEFRPYPAIVVSDILSAATLGQMLDEMRAIGASGGLWRLFRTLHVYTAARTIPNLLDRIHQYCRCIDGLILPDIGKSRQQFKSRTELFIGPKHHQLMGELYDIRSNVEHLHENRYLEVFNREVRLDLMKKEAVIEHIARKALVRVVNTKALWASFGSTPMLAEFWAIAPYERQRIWGDPIDPLVPIAEFDPRYIHDGQLGKE